MEEQKHHQSFDVPVSDDTQSEVVPSPKEEANAAIPVTPDQTIVKGDNAIEKPRGRPFRPGESGNPAGRPRGARNWTTLAAEQLLDGEAEVLVQKVIDLAKGNNFSALKLCMQRILPVRRDRLLLVDMPDLKSVDDAPQAIAAITASVTAGELGIADGVELVKMVESYVRTKQGTIRHNESAARFLDAEKRRDEDRELEEMLAGRRSMKE